MRKKYTARDAKLLRDLKTLEDYIGQLYRGVENALLAGDLLKAGLLAQEALRMRKTTEQVLAQAYA